MNKMRQHIATVSVVLPLLTALTLLIACTAETLPTTAPVAILATEAESSSALATASLTETPTASSTPLPTGTSTAVPTVTPTPTATPCVSPGQVISDTFSSGFTKSEHNYRIYLPPCYDDGYRYPALYLMAGNIHDESYWDKLGIDEAADAAVHAGELAPFLIVMPDGGWLANETSGGPGSYESLILDELIPHVQGQYCIWAEPQARGIGGISRGGYWALEIAFRFPEHFVSVGGHSAALLDQHAEPHIDPQSTALNNNLGDLRIYLDIGADDYVRDNTIRLHEDLQEAGILHAWHLNEGRHADDYWSSHVAEYLRWYGEAWSLPRHEYPPCP